MEGQRGGQPEDKRRRGVMIWAPELWMNMITSREKGEEREAERGRRGWGGDRAATVFLPSLSPACQKWRKETFTHRDLQKQRDKTLCFLMFPYKESVSSQVYLKSEENPSLTSNWCIYLQLLCLCESCKTCTHHLCCRDPRHMGGKVQASTRKVNVTMKPTCVQNNISFPLKSVV